MIKYTILKRVNSTGWTSKTYYVRFYNAGKLTYFNTEETNKKLADVKAREIISKIPVKTKVTEASIKHLTLKQYLINNDWFDETENPLYKEYKLELSTHSFELRTSKRNTRALYRLIFDFGDSLGNILYYSITKEDINQMKSRMLTYNISNRAKNSMLESLASVYGYLIRNDKYIKSNPFSKKIINYFPIKEKAKYVFAPYMIYYIFNMNVLSSITPKTCSQRKWDFLLYNNYIKAFKFAAYTGMRKSEITALTVGQIENRVVHINRAWKDDVGKIVGLPKNGKSRDIYLCDEIYAEIVGNLEGKGKSDFVFESSNGGTIHGNYNDMWTRFKNEIFEIFDIELSDTRFSPHGLRKSLNTNLLKYASSNLKESMIRFYCGWSDAINTLTPVQEGHYTGFGTNELARVASEIQRMYITDVVNEVTFNKKQDSKNLFTDTTGELEKMNFLEKVEEITGNKLIELIKDKIPEKKLSYYSINIPSKHKILLDELDDEIRNNMRNLNQIKLKKLMLLAMNFASNKIAINRLHGTKNEYQSLLDYCNSLMLKNHFSGDEFEKILRNNILEKEVKDIAIKDLMEEIWKDYINTEFVGNLVDN